MTNEIRFSTAPLITDNNPEQLSLNSAQEFFEWLQSNRGTTKGQRYICGPMSVGTHDKPDQYPGEKNWRLKRLALPRRFIAFDVDHFDDPKDLERLRNYFSRWRSLLHTTASSKPNEPRARAIVILDEDIAPASGELLGKAVEQEIEMSLGSVFKFDSSVYKANQPIFTPLVGGDVWVFDGPPITVSAYQKSISKASTHQIHSTKIIGGVDQAIPTGARNMTILSKVGRWRGLGLSEDEILSLARTVNQSNTVEPLDDLEIQDICSRYAHQTRLDQHPSIFRVAKEIDCFSAKNRPIPNAPPPARDYVFGNTVTPGTLSVLGGSGGASKTMLAMQICAASACGGSVGEIQVAEGCSLLLLGEEDDAERDRRLGGICSHFKHSISRVENRVLCIGAAGIDIRLTQKVDANSHPTALEKKIIEVALSHASECGVPLRFIVIDHARLVLGGDPNNAEDVTQLTRVLTNIARTTGASVLLIAHSPKSVLSKAGNEINAADIAGSSAFVDNGRTAFMAYGMREEEAKRHYVPEAERHNWVRVQNVKANYAQSGLGWWFKRVVVPEWEVAVLEQQGLASTEVFTSNKRATLQNKVLDHLRLKPGESKRALRDRAGRKGVFGVSGRELMTEIEEMLETGLLTARAPTPEERRRWKLSGQVREILVSNAPC